MPSKKRSPATAKKLTKQEWIDQACEGRSMYEMGEALYRAVHERHSLARRVDRLERTLDNVSDNEQAALDDAAWVRRLLIEVHGYRPVDIDAALHKLRPLGSTDVLRYDGTVEDRAANARDQAEVDLQPELNKRDSALHNGDKPVARVISLVDRRK